MVSLTVYTHLEVGGGELLKLVLGQVLVVLGHLWKAHDDITILDVLREDRRSNE